MKPGNITGSITGKMRGAYEAVKSHLPSRPNVKKLADSAYKRIENTLNKLNAKTSDKINLKLKDTRVEIIKNKLESAFDLLCEKLNKTSLSSHLDKISNIIHGKKEIKIDDLNKIEKLILNIRNNIDPVLITIENLKNKIIKK